MELPRARTAARIGQNSILVLFSPKIGRSPGSGQGSRRRVGGRERSLPDSRYDLRDAFDARFIHQTPLQTPTRNAIVIGTTQDPESENRPWATPNDERLRRRREVRGAGLLGG